LKAFNFETLEVNGHNSAEVRQAFRKFELSSSDQPKALIAQTIKGQGLSFMQGQNHWHYTRLTRETYEAALKELGV
jgi:transketolase